MLLRGVMELNEMGVILLNVTPQNIFFSGDLQEMTFTDLSQMHMKRTGRIIPINH